MLHADENGKQASVRSVRSCIAKAIGDRLGEACAAMEAPTAMLTPEGMSRAGFGLYEQLRSDAPAGAQG